MHSLVNTIGPHLETDLSGLIKHRWVQFTLLNNRFFNPFRINGIVIEISIINCLIISIRKTTIATSAVILLNWISCVVFTFDSIRSDYESRGVPRKVCGGITFFANNFAKCQSSFKGV